MVSKMSELIKKFETDEFDSELNRTVHREYKIYVEPIEDEKVLKKVVVERVSYYKIMVIDAIAITLDTVGNVLVSKYRVGPNTTNLVYIKFDSGETPGFLWRETVEDIKTLDDLRNYIKDMIGYIKDLADMLSL